MNSLERVKITLNHEEPDMIPIDLGGHQSGIHVKAYKKLLDFLNIKYENIQYCDFVQQIALLCEEFLERFQIDIGFCPIGGKLHPEFKFDVEILDYILNSNKKNCHLNIRIEEKK